MKKHYKILPVLFGMMYQNSINAQCGVTSTLGTASNMFTHIINSTNPVAANKDLNTVVFIHRNDAGAFGGNSGQLRYDLSTNGGSSWTTNQGVLNPVGTSLARYPNVAIYNPSLNVTPSSAYLLHMCATINNAAAWNGNVTGVRQLNGTGNTEFYNQPAGPLAYIPRNIVKGAPGVFWAIDAQWGTSVAGFNVYKGTWNNGTNDISWATNYTVTPPFNTTYANFAFVGNDYSIAFDPTGMKGWFGFLGHVTPGPLGYAYYPVLYKTIDGGVTWSGPIQVDLNNFGCITANISGIPTANTEHDLVVDVNGNPHFFTTVGGGSNYTINYSTWHHMYDITLVNGLWVAYDVANVNGAGYTWGVSPNFVTQYQNAQAARSADGNKVFFTWTENSSYSLGSVNQSPNLFGRAFDVVSKQWTVVKDFTSCNPALAGNILFPHVAEEVLEPANNIFKLATVYAQAVTPGDPGLTSSFRFLDNITFTTTEFSTPTPTLAVSILQGTSALVCSSGSINLSGGAAYDAFYWSNGVQTNVNPVSTPGVYTLTAMSACNVGTASINVMALTASVSLPQVPAICEGIPTVLTAIGNANSYSWQPGNASGSTTTIIPTTTTIYTLEAYGDQNCMNTVTVDVVVSPAPVLTVTGSSSVCLGSSVSQTVSGAVNYLWIGNGGGPVVSLTPTANTTYSVYGTDANLCIGEKTINITVVAGPTVNAAASKTLICPGETVSVVISPVVGVGYTIQGPSGTTTVGSIPIVGVSPSSSFVYTVTGQNSTGCAGNKMLSITVSPCTGIESLNGTADKSLIVYPNPNNGEFSLSADSDINLNIINELGQLVKAVVLDSTNNHKASVSGLSTGIYFIVGKSGDTVLSQKIVITK